MWREKSNLDEKRRKASTGIFVESVYQDEFSDADSDTDNEDTDLKPLDLKKTDYALILTDIKGEIALITEKSCLEIVSLINQELEKNLKQPDDIKCLKKINKIVANSLAEMNGDEKVALSATSAWFFWKFSKWQRMQFHYQPPSDKAYQLAHLAQIAIGVTNKIVAKGSLNDPKNNDLKLSEWISKVNEFAAVRGPVEEKYKKFSYQIGRQHGGLHAALTVKLSEKFQIGNCHEKIWILADFLRKIGVNSGEVTIFNLPNHEFIVLGRILGSDPNDYTTWGNDAVVCDPWSNQYYFVRDIPKLLNDCRMEQYEPALWLNRESEPEAGKIYFQKKDKDLIYYFLNDQDKIEKGIISKVGYERFRTLEEIKPLFQTIFQTIIDRGHILKDVVVRNYLQPFHPFTDNLQIIEEQGINSLKEGFELLYLLDPELAFEHGINTCNLALMSRIFSAMLDCGINIDWQTLQFTDDNFKKICAEELIKLALPKGKNKVALNLLKLGYGTSQEREHIAELESKPMPNSLLFQSLPDQSEGEEFDEGTEIDLDDETTNSIVARGF